MEQATTFTRLPKKIIKKTLKNPLLSDIMLVSCGYRTGDSHLGYNIYKEPADKYLLKYCIRGKGWYEVGTRRYQIKSGDILLSRNFTEHSYGVDPEQPWDVYWVYFIGRKTNEYMDLLFTESPQHVFNLGYDSKLESFFYEILATLKKGYAFQYLLYSTNILKSILAYLYNYIGHDPKTNSKELEEIVGYMLNEIYSTITLEQLSERMNMSRDHFSKLFKKRYGYSPIDYFIQMKMQKACELLTITKLNISEIAEKLNYKDNYYFSRLFKRKIGISPSEYRNKFSQSTFS